MTVRTVRPEELDACCAIGDGQRFADVVRTLSNEGRCSLDLCFGAEHEGKPVGRVFFLRDSSATELNVFGLYVDRSAHSSGAGEALLTEALSTVAASGATRVGCAIYDIYERDVEQMRALLEATGFKRYQEKRRYVWKDEGTPVAVPSRLEFRSLAEVGEGVFTDAARRVTEGTLDQADKADLARYGLEAAGRMYVAVLKDIEFLPDEWQLGYLPDGKLCGLVVPQHLPLEDEGTINYIGVVPELRGSGYGYDLLMRGTALLQRRGLKKVIGETDVENRPMHAALERAGYRHRGTMQLFTCDLVNRTTG